MSTSLAKTKRRIVSIEQTEKTTKAMELIASVKVKRFRGAYERGVEYNRALTDLMGYLFGQNPESLSHYGRPNDPSLPTLYIALGSSMGLCGAYNANMYRLIERTVKKEDVLAPIGNKLANHYSRNALFPNLNLEYMGLDKGFDMASLSALGTRLKDVFNAKKYSRIVVLYTHYVNSITFVPLAYQLLPVQIGKKEWPKDSYCPPIVEGGANKMVHALMPDYLTSALYDLFLESQLSEQASRRSAMDTANDNADELLRKLHIEYNKTRQSAITQEITEVVGGASANTH